MRPNTVLAERTGDLGGVKHAMSFDENSVAHLMSVLTDLYSDPELAVIREYSTNALDSHIAAGVKRPIEIILPNGLSPFFKIQDYGLGMNGDDIQNIYSKYGASTKRESDTQVGMLGLGCKSALTYTQQFTLVGVKNGMKCHVAISRTENGSGVMEVIDESPTDESNGVTVIIPAKYGNLFEHKCRNFFKYWEHGTVLVNGEEPEKVSGRHLNDRIILTKDNEDIIVMGNVPYKVANGHSLFEGRNYRNRFGIVARVDIGEVNFTPSREALHYTNLTIETIERIKGEVKVGLNNAIQKDIDASESHMKAAEAYLEWQSILGNGYNGYMPKGITYKNEVIPQNIDGNFITYVPNNARYSVNRYPSMPLARLVGASIIRGFEHTNIASHYREKIRKWLSDGANPNQQMVYLCDNPDDLKWAKWVGEDNIVEWETVRSVKLERQRTPRNEVEYDAFWQEKYTHLPLKDFPKGARVVLTTPKERPTSRFLSNLFKFSEDVFLVMIQNHRHEKFIRENPGAVTIREFLKNEHKKLIDSMSEDDLMTLNMDYESRNILPLLDENSIDDPGFKNAIRAAKGFTTSDMIKKYGYLMSLEKEIPHFWLESTRKVSYINKYPLLLTLTRVSSVLEHAYIYVNAVYAAENKENNDN